MNKYVLTVPDEWKDRISELNIPSDYSDDPDLYLVIQADCTAILHMISTSISSTLYVYLLQKTLTELLRTDFDEESKEAIEALFAAEYEFKSVYIIHRIGKAEPTMSIQDIICMTVVIGTVHGLLT